MTVQELIEELEDIPLEAEVTVIEERDCQGKPNCRGKPIIHVVEEAGEVLIEYRD